MRNSGLQRQIEFIWYRAIAEIRSDLSRGFLGFGWWVAEPIFYMLVFYVIFGLIYAQKDEHFVAFLLSGLIFWKWFDSSIRNATVSIQQNMSLINQVYLPKLTFPIIAIITSTLKFSLVFSLLLGFLIVQGITPTLSWLTQLPFLLLLQLLLMIGIGMTFAAITPFIPDIKFLVDNGMLLLFFLSGIFFRFEKIPEILLPYFKLNPIGMLIAEYRNTLIMGQPPHWAGLIPAILMTVFFLLAGYYLLAKYDRHYAKRAFL